MIALSVPPFQIEIVDGDIAAQDVDAIVNAANNHFWMGSGVAGAIKARGGIEIERDAMAQGPGAPGQCVVTPAGRLAARYVIHAAVMGQDLRTSADVIGQATRCALAAADERQVESIALPALGTGVGGFPLAGCARIMLDAVRSFAPRAKHLRVVRFVLFGRAAYDEFAASLNGPPATN